MLSVLNVKQPPPRGSEASEPVPAQQLHDGGHDLALRQLKARIQDLLLQHHIQLLTQLLWRGAGGC